MQLGPGNLVQLVRAETELTHVASAEDEERLMMFGWSCNVIIPSALRRLRDVLQASSLVLAPAGEYSLLRHYRWTHQVAEGSCSSEQSPCSTFSSQS